MNKRVLVSNVLGTFSNESDSNESKVWYQTFRAWSVEIAIALITEFYHSNAIHTIELIRRAADAWKVHHLENFALKLFETPFSRFENFEEWKQFSYLIIIQIFLIKTTINLIMYIRRHLNINHNLVGLMKIAPRLAAVHDKAH